MKNGITTEQMEIAREVMAQAVLVAAESAKLEELKDQFVAAVGDTTVQIYLGDGGKIIINEASFKITTATTDALLKGVPIAVLDHFTETKISVTATKIASMAKSGDDVVRSFFPMLNAKLEKMRGAAQKKLAQSGKHLSVKVEIPKATETQ